MTMNKQRRPGGGSAASDFLGRNVADYSSTKLPRHAPCAAPLDRAASWLILRRGVRPLLAPMLAELAGLGGGR